METPTTPATVDPIDKIAAALAKAQGAIENPAFDKEAQAKGGRRYKYASLAAVLKVARPACSANGIAIVQCVQGDRVVTRLAHESGQHFEAWYPIPPNGTDHERGSAITYGCRYTLAPMLGIAGEDDDDGHAANEVPPEDIREKLMGLMAEASVSNKALMDYCRNNGLNCNKEPAALRVVSDLPAASAASLVRHWPTVQAAIKVAAMPKAAPVAPPPAPKPEAAPVETPAQSAGMAYPKHPSLAAKMKIDGVTPEALHRLYVAKGHKPDTMTPDQLPAEYCELLLANWAKALPSMKGN